MKEHPAASRQGLIVEVQVCLEHGVWVHTSPTSVGKHGQHFLLGACARGCRVSQLLLGASEGNSHVHPILAPLTCVQRKRSCRHGTETPEELIHVLWRTGIDLHFLNPRLWSTPCKRSIFCSVPQHPIVPPSSTPTLKPRAPERTGLDFCVSFLQLDGNSQGF